VAHQHENRCGIATGRTILFAVWRGDDGEPRPDFNEEDYRTLVRKLPHWAKDPAVHTQKSREMRMLLWDAVIVLANSGIRHGTEAENLRWRHVHVWGEKGRVYMEFQGVSGKTKSHNVMCRPGAIAALRRIHTRTNAIAGTDFEAMLKQRLDLPVFTLPNGTVSRNLDQKFERFMDETKLMPCPVAQQNRTLYSLRHTYATFALINDGMDIHVLARHMGTSIPMIELHCNHVQPRMKRDMLSGPDYGLLPDYKRHGTTTLFDALPRKPGLNLGRLVIDKPSEQATLLTT
jgi:integrase